MIKIDLIGKGFVYMNIKKVIRWLPVLLWMGIIFYLSAQPAKESSELSSVVMNWLLVLVENWLAVDESFFHFVVRKGAHLSAYFILAVLTMFAVETSFSQKRIQAGVVFVICVLYAMSDELHQLFVPGRSGQISDVGIDAVGAILGIGIYIIVQKGLRVWRA